VLFTRWFCKQQLPERVATTDLVHAVAKRAEKTGTRFYFLGATPQVNDAAVAKMKELYPDLIFAGARNGYFTADQEDAVIEEVIKSGTDILWVGFGIPLEQQFVSRNIDKLKGVAVIKTCGGLFDFLAGRNKRAPQWMQDMGLEWLHRMLQEPRRLGKRYLLTNPLAIYALLQHRFFPKRAAAAKKLPRTKTRPNPKPYQMSQPK
jgi:exopolysaccharide biosynthesis WecB/TagA/CpsF family protein